MGLFDDVVVNAKSAANVVSKKAGTLYDISKLKVSAASARGELNKKFREFGEAVYDGKPESELEELKAQIKEQKENLKEITDILKSMKNQTVCPECGATVVKDAQFCHLCGASLPTDVEFCKKCGAVLQKESNFCISCGAPVEKEDEDTSSDAQ
jgi:ribosomal protein L40E